MDETDSGDYRLIHRLTHNDTSVILRVGNCQLDTAVRLRISRTPRPAGLNKYNAHGNIYCTCTIINLRGLFSRQFIVCSYSFNSLSLSYIDAVAVLRFTQDVDNSVAGDDTIQVRLRDTFVCLTSQMSHFHRRRSHADTVAPS